MPVLPHVHEALGYLSRRFVFLATPCRDYQDDFSSSAEVIIAYSIMQSCLEAIR
jgi:hypothetical protein